MELLKTIAMLCSFSNGNAKLGYVQTQTLSCQKYYVRCISESRKEQVERLKECISDRKL